MLKKLLVTGENGQLGKSLQKIASDYPDIYFTFVGRGQLDLSETASIETYFKSNTYDAIINCAAYTAVDKAESESQLADQINHLAVKQLAEIAKQQDAFLIHISTDYVFDGTNHKPYLEADRTNPINVYGVTKLRGEQAIQAVNPLGAIIRTAWVYSEFGNNFVKTMLKLGKERDSLNIIYDQIGTPTYATDLAKAIMVVVLNQKTKKLSLDTYHYANEGVCSWYDFAKEIFEISDTHCQINPIESQDYPTPAKRPFYSLLNKTKITNAYALKANYWKDSLKQCVAELQ